MTARCKGAQRNLPVTSLHTDEGVDGLFLSALYEWPPLHLWI